MLKSEVLIGEGLSTIYRRAASAVAVQEVSTLDHEVGDLESTRLAGDMRLAEMK